MEELIRSWSVPEAGLEFSQRLRDEIPHRQGDLGKPSPFHGNAQLEQVCIVSNLGTVPHNRDTSSITNDEGIDKMQVWRQ